MTQHLKCMYDLTMYDFFESRIVLKFVIGPIVTHQRPYNNPSQDLQTSTTLFEGIHTIQIRLIIEREGIS